MREKIPLFVSNFMRCMYCTKSKRITLGKKLTNLGLEKVTEFAEPTLVTLQKNIVQ